MKFSTIDRLSEINHVSKLWWSLLCACVRICTVGSHMSKWNIIYILLGRVSDYPCLVHAGLSACVMTTVWKLHWNGKRACRWHMFYFQMMHYICSIKEVGIYYNTRLGYSFCLLPFFLFFFIRSIFLLLSRHGGRAFFLRHPVSRYYYIKQSCCYIKQLFRYRQTYIIYNLGTVRQIP